MAKRQKSSSQPRVATETPRAAAPLIAHPPAKSPTLLAVSMALFALWFAFLLVVAIWG